ncbi:MAG: hypothetical protein R2690_11665 [Acidimicrobiales bacterium]
MSHDTSAPAVDEGHPDRGASAPPPAAPALLAAVTLLSGRAWAAAVLAVLLRIGSIEHPAVAAAALGVGAVALVRWGWPTGAAMARRWPTRWCSPAGCSGSRCSASAG